MKILKKIGYYLAWWAVTCGFGAMLLSTSAYLYLSPKLPSAESYNNIRLENPLRIYSADNKLIAEYGNKRRNPIKYEDVPPLLIDALIASEDTRFYRHNGVDLRGLVRAVLGIVTGNDSGGGSTLTMQVAKNISFEGEDPYSRKFKEILLALQIEKELSKKEILELYLNRIFFGISAYGISAASQQYYNKQPNQLSLAEMAMMVAILPAPNAYNPLRSPQLSLDFRGRVLRRMNQLGMIDERQYRAAESAPITAARYGRQPELQAPYIAELVRQQMVERYGDLATVDGFEVYTSIDSRMQLSANQALRNGLETYDRRHGYRGGESHLDGDPEESRERWLEVLSRMSTVASMEPALVRQVDERSITALRKNGESVTLPWEGIRWAKRFINSNAWGSTPDSAMEVAKTGDLIRITRNAEGAWELGQIPAVNGGLVSLNPSNGAIRALTGGYDYYASKFNRITQAQRQPGSNFKPFLYAAALDSGYTAASLINDAPLPRSDYRPENFNRQFLGPLRLKYALTQSKNLVSLRLYDALGSDVVLPYVSRFGFDTTTFPRNDLTVAIGSHAVTPLEMATGYTVFANGGYKVEPFLIERIVNFNDGEVYRHRPHTVCADAGCGENKLPARATPPLTAAAAAPALSPGVARPSPSAPVDVAARPPQFPLPAAPRVIDERVAYVMNTILRSVITEGSGRPADRAIDRNDLHGKTGTTNDANDLWFSGFNGDVVTTVYVGFDQPQTLGRSEQAAIVSLPIWIEFMQEVLAGTEESSMAQPDGLVTVRINSTTGLRACPDDEDAIFEIFRKEKLPEYGCNLDTSNGAKERGDASTAPGPIF